MPQLAMTDAVCTSTPAQLRAAQVLGALADRIEASLTRHIKADQPVTDSMFVVQGFLCEFRHTVVRLSQRINALGCVGGPFAGGEDAAELPALLDDIERQTWYLIGLVESLLSKRFGGPFYQFRPDLAALGEKALVQIRDLYRQFVDVVRNPPARADDAPVTLRMTLDVEVEVGRLILQMEKLSLGDLSSGGVDLSRPPSVAKRLSISRKFAAADSWAKFLPVLAILLGGFALGFAATYYWATVLIIGLGLLALGLIFKYPWAFILAMLLGESEMRLHKPYRPTTKFWLFCLLVLALSASPTLAMSFVAFALFCLIVGPILLLLAAILFG